MEHMKNLGNLAVIAAVYAGTIITLGAWWKVMEKLFCIGYGC